MQGRVSYSNYLQKEKSSEVFFDLSGFGQPYTEENHEQCRQGETLPNCGYVRKTSFEQKNKGLQLGVYYIFNELISFDSLIGLSKIDNIFYDLQEYYPIDNGIFVEIIGSKLTYTNGLPVQGILDIYLIYTPEVAHDPRLFDPIIATIDNTQYSMVLLKYY